MNTDNIQQIITSMEQDELSGGEMARLFNEAHEELHRLARAMMRHERIEHTLQPTALLNETFLKLNCAKTLNLGDDGHFIAIAANAMRQVLIDHARKKKAEKRGGHWNRVPLSSFNSIPLPADRDVLDLHDALEAFTGLDERAGRVVEMRIFGGLTMEEIAAVLGVTRRTIHNDWKFALTWLRRELDPGATS